MSEEIKELRYQIIFQRDNVTSIYAKSIVDEIINDEEIEDVNTVIHYTLKLENKNWIVLLSLSSNNFNESNIKLIENHLNDSDDVLCIIKLKDEESIKSINQFRDEIFNLEMEIREILFIILQENFPSAPWYKVLQEIAVSVPELKNIEDREKFLKNRKLNELFFLLFTQYKELERPKTINHEDLLELIKKNSNFEELKKEINDRGITKSSHQDFLAKIGTNLKSIEDFRNDLAHSRFVDENKLVNYTRAKEQVEEAIKEFRQVNNLNLEEII